MYRIRTQIRTRYIRMDVPYTYQIMDTGSRLWLNAQIFNTINLKNKLMVEKAMIIQFSRLTYVPVIYYFVGKNKIENTKIESIKCIERKEL